MDKNTGMTDNRTAKIRKRYNRIAGVYDWLEAPMEHMFGKWRREMMDYVHGDVLEVGVGTGKNLPYYPDDVSVTAIDFSPPMVRKARARAAELDTHIDVVEMDAQDLDFEDNRFDTAVTSCVFCSVPDPVQGLKEIRRVCKPDGSLVMLEHVRSNKPILGPLMDVVDPIPVRIYGAHINRQTVANLKKAGFRNIEVHDLWLDIVKLIRAH